jgi:hypothetical protein
MNYKFSTASERIAVLEDLRKPNIFFPASWEPRRSRQRESEFIDDAVIIHSFNEIHHFKSLIRFCNMNQTIDPQP